MIIEAIKSLFSKWKENSKLKRSQRMVSDRQIRRSCDIYSDTPSDRIGGPMIYKIITTGISEIEAGPFYLSGTLNNGEKFKIWNSNKWYAWIGSGEVGDVKWKGYISAGIKIDLKNYLLKFLSPSELYLSENDQIMMMYKPIHKVVGKKSPKKDASNVDSKSNTKISTSVKKIR